MTPTRLLDTKAIQHLMIDQGLDCAEIGRRMTPTRNDSYVNHVIHNRRRSRSMQEGIAKVLGVELGAIELKPDSEDATAQKADADEGLHKAPSSQGAARSSAARR